jgi:hypothetical protein
MRSASAGVKRKSTSVISSCPLESQPERVALTYTPSCASDMTLSVHSFSNVHVAVILAMA